MSEKELIRDLMTCYLELKESKKTPETIPMIEKIITCLLRLFNEKDIERAKISITQDPKE